jgi:hypothetical protein
MWSFPEYQELNIYSRDINIKLWWDNYYMRLQDLKRKSVH